MFKDLKFIWTKHPKEKFPDRQYLDFFVSNISLRDYLGVKNKYSVTPFGFFPSKEEYNRALREFRLEQKTRLSGNRVEFYICEECGDIGCGSVTGEINDMGDRIVWSNFAFQNNEDEIGNPITIEKIEFERQDYFKAFSLIKT